MSGREPRTYSKHSDGKSRSKRRRGGGAATSEPTKKEPKKDRDNGPRAVIVDSGAYSIKAGPSTQRTPTVIPNCIAKAKSERKRLFVGDQIEECRDCSGLYFMLPTERGYVTKWDVQKPIWDYAFGKNVCPINELPVVLTQPLFNFKSIQDCVDEIFFEEYEVSSMFRLNPTDLARLKYAEDKNLNKETPCLIIDTGFSYTHVIPYINNGKYLSAVKRLNVGGKLLTNHLKDVISYRQYNVMEETYVINQVKEDTCYVCGDMKTELDVAEKSQSVVKNYVLPDFNNVRRGYVQDPRNKVDKEDNCQILRLNNERFAVPEILFHPSDIGMKCMGLAEAVTKCIYKCPEKHRELLAKNILVVGGNAKFAGFKTRLYKEVRSLLPQKWDVHVHKPDDPAAYPWAGGKALTRYPDFKSFLVTKNEYEELGSTIVQQRFNSFMSHGSASEGEEEEEADKCLRSVSVTCKYLDRIKGGAIFGKFDSGCNGAGSSVVASEVNKSVSESPVGAETPLSVVCDDKDSVGNSEDVSRDSFRTGSVDGSDLSKARNARSGDGVGSVSGGNLNFDCSDELIDSVDLFPLGFGSYL